MAQSRPVAFASVNDVGERKGFLGLFGKKKNAVDKARDKLKDGEPDEETKQELATAGVVVLVVGLVAYGIKKFLDSSNTTTTTRRHKKKTKIYKPAVTADPATKDAYANVTSVTTAPAM